MDRKRLVIVAMAGGMLLITLDFFGLTVALPKIGEDLKASTSSLLWVVNAYLLAFAAPIFAAALSVVSNAFPANERSSAIGIWSGIGCVGSAIGPFVAGVLTQTASWRLFFFINVPIGIGVMILTVINVAESKDETFTGR